MASVVFVLSVLNLFSFLDWQTKTFSTEGTKITETNTTERFETTWTYHLSPATCYLLPVTLPLSFPPLGSHREPGLLTPGACWHIHVTVLLHLVQSMD